MSELFGKELDPYHILEQIGTTGMATVYKAYQASFDRYLGIKVLPPYHANEPGSSMRFIHEARTFSFSRRSLRTRRYSGL